MQIRASQLEKSPEQHLKPAPNQLGVGGIASLGTTTQKNLACILPFPPLPGPKKSIKEGLKASIHVPRNES